MIVLEVQEYCHKCRGFEPIVEKLYGMEEVLETVVTCEHNAHCEWLKSVLTSEEGESKK